MKKIILSVIILLYTYLLFSQRTWDEDNFSLMKLKGSWGIYDGTNRKWIVQQINIDIQQHDYSFSFGLLPVKVDNIWYYLNLRGELEMKTNYDRVYSFRSSGLAIVERNQYGFKKIGVIDRNGKEVIKLEYDGNRKSHYHYDDEYFVLFNSNLSCLFDKKGKKIIDESRGYQEIGFYEQTSEHEYASQFFNFGLCPVKKNEKFGFINKNGELTIPLQYDNVQPFVNGVAAVKKNGKWGMIDTKNKTVIPFIFDRIGDGLHHMLLVEDADYYYNNLCVVAKNINGVEKYGFIDKNGNIVIPIQYDWVDNFDAGKAQVELNGQRFYIDTKGKRNQ